MASKVFLALCSSALLVQAIFGQAVNLGGNVDINVNSQSSANYVSGSTGSLLLQQNSGYGGPGLSLGGLGLSGLAAAPALASCGCGGTGLAPLAVAAPLAVPAAQSYGGALLVTSSSPLAPSGVSVSSVNDLSGQVVVAGELPLLAAVAFEGQVPSGGAAGVSYSCGDSVGISNVGAPSAGYGVQAIERGALASGLYGAGLVNTGLLNAGGCSCGLY